MSTLISVYYTKLWVKCYGIVTATSFRGGGSSGITIDSSGNVTKPTSFSILHKPNGI